MSAAAATPHARPQTTLLGARIRSNPRLTLIPFSALPATELPVFGALADDATLHGAVRDERGAVKVADNDTARLLELLREPQRVEGELAADEFSLARLVLDRMIEVETGAGDFVSGSKAYDAVCGAFTPPPPATKTARLSQMALQHAQGLEIDDAVRVSVRLYFYGRLAASPDWLGRHPTRGSVERFLHIEPGGTLARRMRQAWRAVDLEPPNDGWFLWCARDANGANRSDRYKLYVSPLPEAVPTVFAVAADIAAQTGAVALKVGNDAASLLRPDKIVLYFSDLDSVSAAAARMARELAGCPGHGVPFTSELADSDGLLSFGIDPPRAEHGLVWQERESWRLWLTNRLAVALVAARCDGGSLEPWQYALARLAFDGVDSSTWAPSADLWDEAE
ncbi:hypothetical protein JQ625_27205 [Bradyrhizobium diazoefficiens]|nr:hypothetical protein [Bradyrhizobium diazoefficiens]MBR0778537.1 hypothetical protein [Bradyrhizobium diazoefficiens]